MKKTLFLIIFITVTLFSVSVMASGLDELLSGKVIHKRQQRIELALELKKQFEALNNAITNLKPDEKKWVEAERVAINSMPKSDSKYKRFADLTKSAEFQQDKMKSNLEMLIYYTDEISKEKTPVPTEIYLWTETCYILTNKPMFDDGISLLKYHKKLYEPQGVTLGGPSMGYGYFFFEFGREIINTIISPFLVNSFGL